MKDDDIRLHPWEGDGPTLWDALLLVAAGFVMGVAASIFFNLVVVIK